MLRKDYNNMIIKRIEKNFDRIMPIGVIGSWIVAILAYFSEIPKLFIGLNVIFGFGYCIIALFRKQLSARSKIVLTISMATASGVTSFLSGGFSSAGIGLLFIANTISVLYLEKKNSQHIAYITVIIFVMMWFIAIFRPVDVLAIEQIYAWIVHLVVLVAYLFVLHTAVYSIKGYLLENIANLEDSVTTVYELAYYDQLTGLPNQYKFLAELTEATERISYGYLVFISIKNLNLINAIYSNHIGDAVLKECVRVFGEIKSEEELLGRIGGNEIAIWMPIRDEIDLVKHVIKYKERFDKVFELNTMTKKIEFCVSCSQHFSGQNSEETYHKAQLALTYAKTRIEERIFFYDKALDRFIHNQERLKEVIEVELLNDNFYLNYQEKYSIGEGKTKSVEALARLKSDTLEIIPPSTFIPIIERLNYSVAFGEMIIRKSLKDYHKLCSKYDEEISMAINVSPTQLFNRKFASYLQNQIDINGIKSEKIIIEITEEVLIENFDIVVKSIKNIRNIGVKISLDDFGSGYSSLNYLTKLEIDEIKIDKSFIDQVIGNEKVTFMLEMIINLSKKLNLNIVAEGIETVEQYDIVANMGCNEIQGYYISKPEPLN